MTTKRDKFPYLTVLVTGLAIVLFSTAGIARMLGWGRSSTGDSGDISALEVSAGGEEAARPRCPECGVIVSTQGHEIVVRMADGSISVIGYANPARWRVGERMMVIAGTDPSQP